MKKTLLAAAALVLSAGAVATATPTLQFDVNGFNAQASGTVNTSFTGSITISKGAGLLNDVAIRSVANGPFVSQGTGGFPLGAFSGVINFVNGLVTGGNIVLQNTNNPIDAYTCNITPSSGSITTFVGGGFKIEALTRNGLFSDASFGSINVSPWFNIQGAQGLPGSFLQFNFSPNANNFATSDMDLFCDVVPLPAAVWGGLATLGGVIAVRRLRRR